MNTKGVFIELRMQYNTSVPHLLSSLLFLKVFNVKLIKIFFIQMINKTHFQRRMPTMLKCNLSMVHKNLLKVLLQNGSFVIWLFLTAYFIGRPRHASSEKANPGP